MDSNWSLLGQTAWHIGRAAVAVLEIALFSLGFAIQGLITGALAAWVYNFIAKRFGGIEVELEPVPALLLESVSRTS